MKKINRILISLLVSAIIPTNIVVAEPSFGTVGNAALAGEAVLVAKPSLDRFTGRTIRAEVSAYNSVSAQTDSTPCIAANGRDICLAANPHFVATNDLALGTFVMFPTIDPGIKYEVVDRMHTRYTGKNVVDIYMGKDVAAALQFGRRRNVEVIILD